MFARFVFSFVIVFLRAYIAIQKYMIADKSILKAGRMFF